MWWWKKKQRKRTIDFKEAQRTQQPAKDVKGVFTKFFESVSPSLDSRVTIDGVSGGAAFGKQIWMWGWGDNMIRCGFSPQSAAMIRTLHAGSIEIYAVSTNKFLQHHHHGHDKLPSMTELQDSFCSRTLKDVKALAPRCRVYKATTRGPGCFYIPQGWLVLEKSIKGPLIFGYRKSLFIAGAGPIEDFEMAGEVLGRPEKHCQVLACLKEAAKKKGTTE